MGKRWNRKRKAEERRQKSIDRKKNLPDDIRRRGYVFNVQFSALMEAYYAYQGLFNLRHEGDGFVPCATDEEKEAERKRFNTSIQSILPASFRLGADCHPMFRDQFEKELDDHAGKPIEITIELNSNHKTDASSYEKKDGDEEMKDNDAEEGSEKPSTITKILPPVRRIPFIPLGYQLSVDRRTIRRNPSLSQFHDWLKIQTNAGFITRQETVSMIPPVVLSVEPHHAVLDMCAAPGSKTSQMLEIVSQIAPGKTEPEGFVVANDSDPKRAYMLIHNLRRINSPATFTGSVDAQFFPQLKGFNNTDGINEGLFDRVLCDVPCSGDGTMRKNPGIWKFWNPLGSFALHPLQINIAMKGATLTKVGGYMCYSTCSMNPIENEAVVAEILRKANGSLELVDKRPDMPGIVARPGWNTWKVMCTLKKDKNKMKKNSPKMVEKRKEWAEKKKAEAGEINQNDVVEEGNPPTDEGDKESNNVVAEKEISKEDAENEEETRVEGEEQEPKPDPVNVPLSWDETSLREKAASLGILFYDQFENVPEHLRKRIRSSTFPPTKEEVEKFHLERCMRCLPHDMDTGGFFIALFKKVAPVGVKARNKNKNESSKNTGPAENSVDEEDEQEKETLITCPTNTENPDSTDMDIDESTSEVDLKSMKGKERGRGSTKGNVGNSDFVPIPADVLPNLIEFYGLGPNFPQDQIMCRECGEAKILYFITRNIKTKLIDCGIQRITVINSGMKVFERNSKESEVRYRVNQEGIHMIAPYMQKRKITANFKDFVQCLNSGAIFLSTFSKDFAEKMRPLSLGAFVVALEGFEDDYGKKMIMVMWRCRGEAVNCLVSKIETDGMKCKLRAIADLNNIEYNPDPPIDRNATEEKADGKEDLEEERSPAKKEKIEQTKDESA